MILAERTLDYTDKLSAYPAYFRPQNAAPARFTPEKFLQLTRWWTMPRSTAAVERKNCLPGCAGVSRNHCMGLIILIIVILLLVGAFPTRGYGFGYGSHGILGTILIIVLILYILGRL
jgi:hypothetical protein